MKPFPLAIVLALVASAIHHFFAFFFLIDPLPSLISQFIFVYLLCKVLLSFSSNGYSKKEVLILTVIIGISPIIFNQLLISFLYGFPFYYNLIFLSSVQWWMLNIWTFLIAFLVLSNFWDKRITKDRFFNS